jgi:phosphinothricin acetyltransferase
MIRFVEPAGDAAAISEIYNYYIENTAITFEEEKLTPSEMESRIKKISAKFPYIVWEESFGTEREVTGYAYINTWKERAAYCYSVEDSIYLKNGREGRGIGKALLKRLLEEADKTSIHAVVAGITLPNEKSIGLHEAFGFKKIAQFEEIGFKQGRWLDVAYWELVLANNKKGELSGN